MTTGGLLDDRTFDQTVLGDTKVKKGKIRAVVRRRLADGQGDNRGDLERVPEVFSLVNGKHQGHAVAGAGDTVVGQLRRGGSREDADTVTLWVIAEQTFGVHLSVVDVLAEEATIEFEHRAKVDRV